MTCGKNRLILTDMTLRRADVADAAVAMIKVIPTHEIGGPGASSGNIGKTLGREFRSILCGTKQRLGISVIVTHARTRVGRFNAQPVEHGQYGRRLQRRAVIAMQHRFAYHGSEIQLGGVLKAKHDRMLHHAGFAAVNVRLQDRLPVQSTLLRTRLIEEAVGRHRLCPVTAGSWYASRWLLGKAGGQLDQPQVQSSVAQVGPTKFVIRSVSHFRLPIKMGIGKQGVYQTKAINYCGAQHQISGLCQMSCV